MAVIMPSCTLVRNEGHASDAINGGRPPKSSKSLPALTGLRGVAAMAVFLCHLQLVFMQIVGLDPLYGLNIFGEGFRGVDLFFILSGFILFHTHSVEFKQLNFSLIVRFYILRFFRVYPLNTIVLLLLVILPTFTPGYVEWHKINSVSQGTYHLNDYSLPSFIQTLLLAQTWTFAKLGTWNEPSWTLSAEVLGYVLFPVMARLIARQQNGTLTTVAAMCSLSLFLIAMIAGGHATGNPSGSFGLIRMFFCFVCGIFLCRTVQLVRIPSRMSSEVTGFSTILIFITLSCPGLGLLSVFGFAGLILGLAYCSGPVNSFMSKGPVMFLGRISFSFYLIHLIPLDLLCWVLREVEPGTTLTVRLGALGVVIFMIFVLSNLAHKYLELPFQRLGREVASNILISQANMSGRIL